MLLQAKGRQDFAEVKDQALLELVVMGSNRPPLVGLGWDPVLRSALYEMLKQKQGEDSKLRDAPGQRRSLVTFRQDLLSIQIIRSN